VKNSSNPSPKEPLPFRKKFILDRETAAPSDRELTVALESFETSTPRFDTWVVWSSRSCMEEKSTWELGLARISVVDARKVEATLPFE
jgi:hypothetical protein